MNTPRNADGTAVESSVKSAAPVSHCHSPSVTTGRMRSGDFVASQCSISRFTHGDCAASGDASSTKWFEPSSASRMEVHSLGVTASPV